MAYLILHLQEEIKKIRGIRYTSSVSVTKLNEMIEIMLVSRLLPFVFVIL